MARRKRIAKSETEDAFGFNPRELTSDQKRAYLKRITERANKRLYRIEKSGRYSYAAAEALRRLERSGRKRFSYHQKTDSEVLNEIYSIEAFLNSKTSLVSNIKKIQMKAFDTLKQNLTRQGIDMEGVPFDTASFYNFLGTQQFKDLAAQYGSDWVVEDIARAVTEDKLSMQQVIKEYKEFMKTDLPLDAVEMKRKGAIESYEQYAEGRRSEYI